MKYTATVIYNETTYTDDKIVAVSATGHKFPDTYTTDQAPTCTADGEESIHCAVCDAIKPDSARPIPMTGHTSGEAVIENSIAATCTADGSYDEVVYCTVCNAELSREHKTVAAAGHTSGTAVIENSIAATCAADGSYDEVVYCTVCNAELSRERKTTEATEEHTYVNGFCSVCGAAKPTTVNPPSDTPYYPPVITSVPETAAPVTTPSNVTTSAGAPDDTSPEDLDDDTTVPPDTDDNNASDKADNDGASDGNDTAGSSDNDDTSDDSDDSKDSGSVIGRAEVAADEGAVVIEVESIEQKEIIGSVTLTKKEKKAVDKGDTIEIVLEIKSIAEKNVPEDDKVLAEKQAEDNGKEIEMFIDMELILKNMTTGRERKITETDRLITVVITIPDEIYSDDKTYSVIRVHDGVAENIGGKLDRANRKLVIITDKFSTYAIASKKVQYEDDESNPYTNESVSGMMLIALSALFVIEVTYKKKK